MDSQASARDATVLTTNVAQPALPDGRRRGRWPQKRAWWPSERPSGQVRTPIGEDEHRGRAGSAYPRGPGGVTQAQASRARRQDGEGSGRAVTIRRARRSWGSGQRSICPDASRSSDLGVIEEVGHDRAEVGHHHAAGKESPFLASHNLRSYSGHPSLHPRGLATAVPLADSDPPFLLGMAAIRVETAFSMWGVL